MSPRDILLAMLVTAIWGINFIAIKLSVEAMPPLIAAALRFLLAAVPAVLFVKPPKAPFWLVIGFGFFMCVALYAFLNIALAIGMPAGLASLVLQAQILFTIILAFFLFGEQPSRRQIIGGLIGFGGIAIIGMERFEGAALVPFLVTIIGALMWGTANVLTKKAGKIDALALTVWGSLIAPVPLLALSLVLDGPDAVWAGLTGLDVPMVANLAYQAYPTTVFGLAIWSGLLAKYPAAMVTPFALLVPITGMAAGWVVLGETISPLAGFGSLVVLIGLAVAMVRRPGARQVS